MLTQKDQASAERAIKQASDLKRLEQLRLHYLGRKGLITKLTAEIKTLPRSRRVAAGKAINQAKSLILAALAAKREQLEAGELSKLDQPLDLTAPAPGPKLGHAHPLAELQKQLIMAFWQLGFEVADGPEIETDWYNFEALNLPPGHPARDMQDTFYLENGLIPRTHTSSVQIRYMEAHRPPVRIIATGNVYRNEDEDATHLWAFQQIEGLVVDKAVSLADLKGTLLYMFRSVLGDEVEIQLRPSYFPYVEPALEVFVSCVVCSGQDPNCKTCKGTGWVEMLGAGMVHPKVLANVGIDPKVYSGFAFGGGIDRIAAVKYRVPDIRYFWRTNLRFLEQF